MRNGVNDEPQTPFFSTPVVDSSLPPPILADGVPQRPPTFRASQEERTEPEPVDDYSTDPDATFEPVDDDPEYADPVPVVVVEPVPHQSPIRDWSSSSFALSNDGKAVRILSAERNRLRAVCGVGALEGVGVAFMRNPTDLPSRSIQYGGVNTAGSLAVAPTVEFSHNGEVWCVLVSDDVDAVATVHVHSEYWLDS